MALFAIWHDDAVAPDIAPALIHQRLAQEAHVVPEHAVAAAIDTASGRWQIAAFACATHFYPAEAQVWIDPAGGACVIHGLIWRMETGRGRLLDAAAVAVLLDRPGRALPADIAGEYAVARLHPCGTLEAFSDAAGLHQLFRRTDGRAAVASRAAFLAALADDWTPDAASALWISAIGYRVGEHSGWRGVAQIPQAHRLVADRAGAKLRATDDAIHLPETRGFAYGGAALIETGVEQAQAALLLGVGDDAIDLPITGGKDSRVILALALAAGLRDRITLFTRGYGGHPDVLAGEAIARIVGSPHRREPPRGSDDPADLTADAFLRMLATLAYQTDGGMGGWDNVSGTAIGREALITGHMGELLKAYAKKPFPPGPLDPVAMVRSQAPFDPIGLLRADAQARLSAQLSDQMAAARAAGAQEGDLPDLFYWRNRVPNWLGGIRGIKAFERQPVMPLGVPALLRLAFRMTPEERKAELAHFELIRRTAPELLTPAFAHQSWSTALEGAPRTPPILAAAGSNLFGNWQWSLNRNPAVRALLSELFAEADLPIWEDMDRAILLAALRERRFDYFDAISLLGLTTVVLHQRGMILPVKLGGEGAVPAIGSRPVSFPGDITPPPAARLTGYLDQVEGAARLEAGKLHIMGTGPIRFSGWLHAPDWPGAAVAIEARVDGQAVAVGAAELARPDLAAAGIGDGRHGFSIEVDVAALAGKSTLALAGFENPAGPIGGTMEIAP